MPDIVRYQELIKESWAWRQSWCPELESGPDSAANPDRVGPDSDLWPGRPFHRAQAAWTDQSVEPMTRNVRADLTVLHQAANALEARAERLWQQVYADRQTVTAHWQSLVRSLGQPYRESGRSAGHWRATAQDLVASGLATISNLARAGSGLMLEAEAHLDLVALGQVQLVAARYRGSPVWQPIPTQDALLDPDPRTGLIVVQEPYRPENQLELEFQLASLHTISWLGVELWGDQDQVELWIRPDLGQDESGWRAWSGPDQVRRIRVLIRPEPGQVWYGLKHLQLGQAEYQRQGSLIFPVPWPEQGRWQFQVDQQVPAGCQVRHDYSYDSGQTWQPIRPGEQVVVQTEQLAVTVCSQYEVAELEPGRRGRPNLWRTVEPVLAGWTEGQPRPIVYRGEQQFWASCFYMESAWQPGPSGQVTRRVQVESIGSAFWDQLGVRSRLARHGLVSPTDYTADPVEQAGRVLMLDESGPMVLRVARGLRDRLVRLETWLWCEWASSSLYTVECPWPSGTREGYGLSLLVELNGSRIVPLDSQASDRVQTMPVKLQAGWNKFQIYFYRNVPQDLDLQLAASNKAHVFLATFQFNPVRTDVKQYHGLQRVCAEPRPMQWLPYDWLAARGPDGNPSWNGRYEPYYSWDEQGRLVFGYDPGSTQPVDRPGRVPIYAQDGQPNEYEYLARSAHQLRVEHWVGPNQTGPILVRTTLIGPGDRSPSLVQYELIPAEP